MKNLLLLFIPLLLFTKCTKEDFDIQVQNRTLGLRSLLVSEDESYCDFEFSAFYDESSRVSRFTTEATFADGSTDGQVLFNDVIVSDFENKFLNCYNRNPNSTKNFDLVCRGAVGKVANFSAQRFRNISDFSFGIYIPQFILPEIISNSEGISLNWNVDNSINNNIFGVLLHYDGGEEVEVFIKSYLFDQSSGHGFISKEDLKSIPLNSRIKLEFVRGNTAEVKVDDKRIKAIAYTFGSKTVRKK